MKSFNSTPPTGPLTETVQIGWQYEHTTTDDGSEVVTLVKDADGNAIPTTYELPLILSTETMFRMADRFGTNEAQLTDFQKSLENASAKQQFETIVELAGVLYGDDFIKTIAGDPTVSGPELMAFLPWAVERFSGSVSEGVGGSSTPLDKLPTSSPMGSPSSESTESTEPSSTPTSVVSTE